MRPMTDFNLIKFILYCRKIILVKKNHYYYIIIAYANYIA